LFILADSIAELQKFTTKNLFAANLTDYREKIYQISGWNLFLLYLPLSVPNSRPASGIIVTRRSTTETWKLPGTDTLVFV